jgi:replication factor C small subunit
MNERVYVAGCGNNNMDMMYVDKYSPNELSDLIGNEGVVDRFKKWRTDPTIPHIMLSGPQGSGKTSLVKAFAKEVYGDEWQANLLDKNASDERGIDTIRTQVKSFAGRSPSINTDINYKILLLDECDSLTKPAQAALRRIIEDYSDNTRFFLSCNYPNKIIPAIQSRCVNFTFTPLKQSEIKSLIDRVVNRESIDAQESALWQIVRIADGDARKALHTLQASVIDGEITNNTVAPLATVLPDDSVEEILDLAVNQEFQSAMETLDENVLEKGIASSRFCKSMVNIIENKDYTDDVKV